MHVVKQWIANCPSRPRAVLAVCAILLAVQIDPWWYSSIDSASYLSMARSLARGTGPTNFGSPLLWYSPGYPALISPFFLFDNRPFLGIAMFQWLLAVGLLLGVYYWARQVSPDAAIWVAGLTVVNHGFWIHFRRPLSEIAFMCALIWVVNILRSLAGARLEDGLPRPSKDERDGPGRPSSDLHSLFGGRLAAGAALTALLCIIRPVGTMIVPAFVVWAWLEARAGKLSWLKAAVASAVIAIAAGTPVALFVAHERRVAAELGGRSYADEFHDAARSPLESYSRGVQLCVSDMGRVCLPGLFKSHGTPGDWTDVNMLVHVPFCALVVYGWFRWRRRGNDLFAWYMPFYLLLIAAHAMDTGARLLLPLLPALFVCVWIGLDRLGPRQPTLAAACLALQAAVGGAYWLAVDLPRARYNAAQWPSVEAMAAEILNGRRGISDADVRDDRRLMLELVLDRPLIGFKR
ncbi:MAG TPA: hypothetical protein VNH11_12410 [Pirellulales bacterium]|nr:hypothetical protein [Pirellulales bacterium]